jgi:hypothetical protein
MPEIPAGQNPIKLPVRRREQLRRVINGEPIGQASLAVGYKSANVGTHALSDTRKKLICTMDAFQLTEVTLVRDYLLPLLNATKTEFFAKDGIVMDDRTVEDNSTRLSALNMTWKLRGAYPKEQSEGPSTLNIAINNVSVVDTDKDKE